MGEPFRFFFLGGFIFWGFVFGEEGGRGGASWWVGWREGRREGCDGGVEEKEEVEVFLKGGDEEEWYDGMMFFFFGLMLDLGERAGLQ